MLHIIYVIVNLRYFMAYQINVCVLLWRSTKNLIFKFRFSDAITPEYMQLKFYEYCFTKKLKSKLKFSIDIPFRDRKKSDYAIKCVILNKILLFRECIESDCLSTKAFITFFLYFFLSKKSPCVLLLFQTTFESGFIFFKSTLHLAFVINISLSIHTNCNTSIVDI